MVSDCNILCQNFTNFAEGNTRTPRGAPVYPKYIIGPTVL